MMSERRKHPRYDISVQVDVRLAHPSGRACVVRGSMVDVCPEGMAVTLYEQQETIGFKQALLSGDQSVELSLELPPSGERIMGKGTVRWLGIGYTAGSQRHLEAGIFLDQMEVEHRVKWEHFVRDAAPTTRQEIKKEPTP